MDRMAGRVIESFSARYALFIPMCRDEIYWIFTEVCQRNSPKTPPPTILPNLCKGIARSKEYIRVYETNSLFIGGLVEPAE